MGATVMEEGQSLRQISRITLASGQIWTGPRDPAGHQGSEALMEMGSPVHPTQQGPEQDPLGPPY